MNKKRSKKKAKRRGPKSQSEAGLKARFTVTIAPELYERVKELAEFRRGGVSGVMEDAVRDYLDGIDRRDGKPLGIPQDPDTPGNIGRIMDVLLSPERIKEAAMIIQQELDESYWGDWDEVYTQDWQVERDPAQLHAVLSGDVVAGVNMNPGFINDDGEHVSRQYRISIVMTNGRLHARVFEGSQNEHVAVFVWPWDNEPISGGKDARVEKLCTQLSEYFFNQCEESGNE